MRAFQNGQRVRVVATYHPLRGMVATVKRRRMADRGAWCEVEGVTPELLSAEVPTEEGAERCFPFGTPEGDQRQYDTILYPTECEPAETATEEAAHA